MLSASRLSTLALLVRLLRALLANVLEKSLEEGSGPVIHSSLENLGHS